jgi:hypothetical protein
MDRSLRKGGPFYLFGIYKFEAQRVNLFKFCWDDIPFAPSIKMKLLLDQYLGDRTVSRTEKEAFIQNHVQPEAAAHVSTVTGIFT